MAHSIDNTVQIPILSTVDIPSSKIRDLRYASRMRKNASDNAPRRPYIETPISRKMVDYLENNSMTLAELSRRTGVKYETLRNLKRFGGEPEGETYVILLDFFEGKKHKPLHIEESNFPENAITDLLAGIYQILINQYNFPKETISKYLLFLRGNYSKFHRFEDLRMLDRFETALDGKIALSASQMLMQILLRDPAGSA